MSMSTKAHPLSLAKWKWAKHKAQSKYRNIPFNFPFEDWYQWWLNHGVDKNINVAWNHQDRPCMCRKGDTGGYEPSNVYFATNSDNVRDLFNNGKIDPYNRVNNRKFRWGDLTVPYKKLIELRNKGPLSDNEKRFFDARYYDWENQHETERLINRWEKNVRRYKKTWETPHGIFDTPDEAAQSMGTTKAKLFDMLQRKKYNEILKKHTVLNCISLEDYIRQHSRYPDPYYFKR